jgi:hypothetical protein
MRSDKVAKPPPAPGQPDLQAVALLCQVLRSDTKALIRANVNSWEIGRPLSAPISRQQTWQ